MDCCPRVAPGRGHGIGPWKIRRGLASPGPGRESETQTYSRARTETATPSDSGTEPATGAGRDTGASGGTRTRTGGGAATPARTGTGSGTHALANKGFGKSPTRAGRGTEPGGRPGTRPRPPGRHPGKPRSRHPTGRRMSGARDPRGEVGCGGAPATSAPRKPGSPVPALLRRAGPLVLGSRLKGRQCRSSLLRS